MMYFDKKDWSDYEREDNVSQLGFEKCTLSREVGLAICALFEYVEVRSVSVKSSGFYIELTPYGEEGLASIHALQAHLYSALTRNGLKAANYSTIVTWRMYEELGIPKEDIPEDEEPVPIQCLEYSTYNAVSDAVPVNKKLFHKVILEAISHLSTNKT